MLQNVQHFVFGLPHDFLNNNIDKLSPLLRTTFNQPYSGRETVIYLLCCAALYLLGLFLYRRRPSENAGNTLAFRRLHPVLIYGVTFCCMLLLQSDPGQLGLDLFRLLSGLSPGLCCEPGAGEQIP